MLTLHETVQIQRMVPSTGLSVSRLRERSRNQILASFDCQTGFYHSVRSVPKSSIGIQSVFPVRETPDRQDAYATSLTPPFRGSIHIDAFWTQRFKMMLTPWIRKPPHR